MPEYEQAPGEDALQRPPRPDGQADSKPSKPAKAPSPRHLNRVAAMQFLYMAEINQPEGLSEALYDFFNNRDHPRDYYAFGETLASGAWEKREEVDKTIREHARNWSFDRIAKVDLAILRLAIYELHFRRDIPPIVSINEAIDLSKEFSTPDAKRFINGILDKLKGTLDRPLRTADV
ncbi:transcription antitermination factor NusB [Ruficoccus amylovorans]|uniref:Transcription antitermination protein NusB n=1 Tax=Ruficoccus amylovorans TaxID=1804625 RepID=A0A842HL90_9BACT|nr:transcription antitermination factor NusB [Ruficoccus amylovorans]MBC2596454.1 transcription antitermination factor NusB [Ruficoccus amylovorans]